jgi:hypothetical protein
MLELPGAALALLLELRVFNAIRPPIITSLEPIMKHASSEARNRTQRAGDGVIDHSAGFVGEFCRGS